MKNGKIPIGDYCRQLIGQSYVTQADLRTILRERGVFLSSNDKKISAAPIVKTGISVEEYIKIKRSYKSREESPKSITRTILLDSDCDLLGCIEDGFNFGDDFDDGLGTLSLGKLGDFSVVDSDLDHLVLDFSIVRNNPIKNWSGESVEHGGLVELKKIKFGDGWHILLTGTYSSKETLDFSRKIFGRVEKRLKDLDLVSKDTKPLLIRFCSFENENRVEFLQELSHFWTGPKLTFKDTVDVNFSPDGIDANAPGELQWMEGGISELKLMGKNIHEIFFLKNKNNHKYILIFENICAYDFHIESNGFQCDGKCKLSIGFSNKDKADSELVVEVLNFKINNNNTGMDVRSIQDEILRIFDSKKIELFHKFSITTQ